MSNKLTLSGLDDKNFRTTIDGKESRLYTLTNHNGCELTICNYGARIVSLLVPDRNGVMTDVVTGHSSIADYLTTEEPYFGAVCGRYANRIARGRFEIDGVVYDKLAINNGPNNLHGGVKGFNSKYGMPSNPMSKPSNYNIRRPMAKKAFPVPCTSRSPIT